MATHGTSLPALSMEVSQRRLNITCHLGVALAAVRCNTTSESRTPSLD